MSAGRGGGSQFRLIKLRPTAVAAEEDGSGAQVSLGAACGGELRIGEKKGTARLKTIEDRRQQKQCCLSNVKRRMKRRKTWRSQPYKADRAGKAAGKKKQRKKLKCRGPSTLGEKKGVRCLVPEKRTLPPPAIRRCLRSRGAGTS